MARKAVKKVTKKRKVGRRAQSYNCPFCLYTGEEQKPAQAHYDKHVKKIAKHAGYVLVLESELPLIKTVVDTTKPVNAPHAI